MSDLKLRAPTRYQLAREDGANRAAATTAILVLTDAVGRIHRAAKLLGVASADGILGALTNREEAAKTLRTVIADLQELVGDLDQ